MTHGVTQPKALRDVACETPPSGRGSGEPAATVIAGAETVLCQLLTPTSREPVRGTPEAIGLDIFADLGLGNKTRIYPGRGVAMISTGIAMQAPVGHYLRVAPRSGLGLKGIQVNAGVVDRDFTGEIKVLLSNVGEDYIEIKHGDRIAQIIAERASICAVKVVKRLEATTRSVAGFGSTGR